MELVCPAGTPAALRAAVDAGADTVYAGFRDETNARNFPGLNFSVAELADGLAYCRARGRRLYLAINTFARAGDPSPWRRAIDDAAALGVDAAIVADIGLLEYVARRHPQLRLHLSVQAGAAHAAAIDFYRSTFAVRRVVLPRVLTVPEIAALVRASAVETEVFAFGGMCPMAEGHCSLSSYVTGKSPNTTGVCSPPSHVRYVTRGESVVSQLGGSTINAFAGDEPAGYPTLCKGRFAAAGQVGYLFEEPVSLSVAGILPELIAAGVSALKIEGRQRGKAYIAEVVAAFRRLIDAQRAQVPSPPGSAAALNALAEGQKDTTGAYQRRWR